MATTLIPIESKQEYYGAEEQEQYQQQLGTQEQQQQQDQEEKEKEEEEEEEHQHRLEQEKQLRRQQDEPQEQVEAYFNSDAMDCGTPASDSACQRQEDDVNGDIDRSHDDTNDSDLAGSVVAPWMRHSFGKDALAVATAAAARCTSQSTTPRLANEALRCEECNARTIQFQCVDCALALCFACADAIHIIASLATHVILPTTTRSGLHGFNASTLSRAEVEAPSPTASVRLPLPSCIPHEATPPLGHAISTTSNTTSAPAQADSFNTATITQTTIALGANRLFRMPECAPRWPRELLHGTVLHVDHGIQSHSSGAYYRVLWLRGIESLANGQFRASLVLPVPWWPLPLSICTTRLAAMRVVLTAERIVRHRRRQHRHQRVMGQRVAPFPSEHVVDELVTQTLAALANEGGAPVFTAQDDHAFLLALSQGTWSHANWMTRIGRGEGELQEESAALMEYEEEEAGEDGDEEEDTWSPRTRQRCLMVAQDTLLLPEAVRSAQMERILAQLMRVTIGFAWARWRRAVHKLRRRDRRQLRETSAMVIQQCVQRHQRRQRRVQCGLFQRTMAIESPLEALERFQKRQRYTHLLVARLLQLRREYLMQGLVRWKSQAGPLEAASRLAALARSSPTITWHPSHGIPSLPRLPNIPVRSRPDGSLEITDAARFEAFRTNHAGPTEASYWILRERILMGPYPCGRAFQQGPRRLVMSRTDARTSLLLQQIGTFICLMTDEELQTHEPVVDANEPAISSVGGKGTTNGKTTSTRTMTMTMTTGWRFERHLRAQHATLTAELQSAVRTQERLLTLAKAELEESLRPSIRCPSRHGSGRERGKREEDGEVEEDREQVQRRCLDRVALAEQGVRTAEQALVSLAPLAFLHLPLPRDGVPAVADEVLTETMLALEQVLRETMPSHRIYVFSLHGHGRTGLVTALLLGRLYGLTAMEALARAQRLHDCQWALRGEAATSKDSVRRAEASPRSVRQRAAVQRLLARSNDAVYAHVVTENRDDRGRPVYSWRAQQRGLTIENFAHRDGFMVVPRPGSEEQDRQAQELVHLQRVAQRESHAAQLQGQRARRKREADAKTEKVVEMKVTPVKDEEEGDDDDDDGDTDVKAPVQAREGIRMSEEQARGTEDNDNDQDQDHAPRGSN